MKTVLFFGFYDRKYSRTKVLKVGFGQNGWEVEECHVDPRIYRGFGKYIRLFLQGLKVRRKKYDIVLVGFPGHNAAPVARLLFGSKVIFDAFLSQYETNVLDRKMYAANSWRARKDRLLDTWGCKLASKVLLDTQSNINFFVKEFSLPQEKFIRVFVGADDELFFPAPTPEEAEFTVHFHGTFIPVQGIQYIVEAADMLRNLGIHFRIVGHGQESSKIDADIKRRGLEGVIERVPKVPVEQIPGFMAGAHIVLGLFGDNDRGLRAIPNKVYEAMAMGKAIITEDGSGIRELSYVAEMFLLVPPANARALADAILALKANSDKRLELGRKARAFFEHELMPRKMVAGLLAALGEQ